MSNSSVLADLEDKIQHLWPTILPTVPLNLKVMMCGYVESASLTWYLVFRDPEAERLQEKSDSQSEKCRPVRQNYPGIIPQRGVLSASQKRP